MPSRERCLRAWAYDSVSDWGTVSSPYPIPWEISPFPEKEMVTARVFFHGISGSHNLRDARRVCEFGCILDGADGAAILDGEFKAAPSKA